MEYRHNTGQHGTIRKCHIWHDSPHTRASDADLRHGSGFGYFTVGGFV